MKQITKRFFKDLLTTNETIFMGVSTELFDTWYIADCKDDYMAENGDYEFRTAEEIGKYLVFSNGSKLSVDDNKYNRYTCYMYEYDNCTVLCSYNEWYDECDEEWVDGKCCYYMIRE